LSAGLHSGSLWKAVFPAASATSPAAASTFLRRTLRARLALGSALRLLLTRPSLMSGTRVARLKSLLTRWLRRNAVLVADHSCDDLTGARGGSFVFIGQ
jgi:hypothetical protein